MYKEVMPNNRGEEMTASIIKGCYVYLGTNITTEIKKTIYPDYANVYVDRENLKLRLDFCPDGKYIFGHVNKTGGTVCIRATHLGIPNGTKLPCVVEGSQCIIDYSNVDLTKAS